jgi:cytochrome c oxidase subunit IV
MQQQGTWERLAPLTGLVFVVITVLVFAIGGSTPGNHDTAQEVQSFYGQHHDKHMALAFVLAIAIPFLLFFVSTLRYELRRAGGTGQLANAAFAGGVLAAAGLGILAFIHLALSDAAGSANTIGTTQTLNVLDSNDFIPLAAGLGVLVLGAGWSTLRHGGLPKWLGWAGVVIGVLTFTPAGFFAFLASALWIALVSILLTQARRSAAPAPAA